ncbi:hypothetical protein FQN53_002237 [Emmonsiellopsis sp. PD_33]|nr:hypothetical protein FQN53_002237 [Emmonsiellopsis sp. PD_33]
MATLAAPATSSNGGLIDPSKQAEYPILLGDRLAGKESAKSNGLIGVTYNHKSKSASRQQRATITAADSSQHRYRLTVQDKAQNAEQTNLVHTYHGSVDPTSLVSESDTSNLVLVFEPKRKAFILEPVTTRLNFNLRSTPGKSTQQVTEQYPQLSVLSEEDQISGDDRFPEGPNEDDAQGTPDESNPYDFRHFLPKAKVENETPTITASDTHNVVSKTASSRLAPPPPTSGRSKSKPGPKPKAQTNPLRPQKRQPKTTTADKTSAKSKPKSAPIVNQEDLVLDSPSSDEEYNEKRADINSASQAAASPGGNIIVDGDLIIDMGSPPPARPAFKLNPRHFASNNTSANEADYDSDDEEDIDDLRLPSPAGAKQILEREDEDEDEEEDEEGQEEVQVQQQEEEVDDDDLAAEMEAAFEESAREEEQERAQRLLQQQQQLQMHHQVVSDDESEVSEEE